MDQTEVNTLLDHYEASRAALDDSLHGSVERLRYLGATWRQIGNALGVTPQAAHQRFHGGLYDSRPPAGRS